MDLKPDVNLGNCVCLCLCTLANCFCLLLFFLFQVSGFKLWVQGNPSSKQYLVHDSASRGTRRGGLIVPAPYNVS